MRLTYTQHNCHLFTAYRISSHMWHKHHTGMTQVHITRDLDSLKLCCHHPPSASFRAHTAIILTLNLNTHHQSETSFPAPCLCDRQAEVASHRTEAATPRHCICQLAPP